MPAESPRVYGEDYWRNFLTNGDTLERRLRIVFKHLPSEPRCHLCAAPFTGAGGAAMRLIGKSRALQNPNTCNQCFEFISTHHGGAEIEASMLFADIRGSTTIAEGLSPTEFRALLDRFYTVALRVVFAHNGSFDKFVGDELVALFFPLITGSNHAEQAVKAARALLVAVGHDDPAGPWVPLGAGVHTGRTWFGAVGEGGGSQLTAVGDAMNTTARLASTARAGEILVTTAAAAAAGLDPALERRSLDLKGKALPTEVVSIRVGPVAAETAA